MRMMLDQTNPFGIDLTSPLAWFVIAMAMIVIALTLSTRRSNTRPRAAATPPPGQPAPNADVNERYRAEWSAAQALFVEDPRAGCERARTIVAKVLHDSGSGLDLTEPLEGRYRAGCALATQPDASTDDLRQAFIDLRVVFDALLGRLSSAER
jgi:hypothetical protein